MMASPQPHTGDYASAMEQGAANGSGKRAVASVARAIAVIEALSAAPEGLGVNELARRIEVNPSSASRLLATLEGGGLVARGATGKYQLGLRFLTLSDRVMARLDVRELARPYLHALVEQAGETTTLSIPTGGEAVTVDFVPGKASVVSMARVGRPNPLHATAIGKTMLAFDAGAALPPAAELTAFTERTITDPAALQEIVAQVRRAGWAESVGERETDLAALAAPVPGADRGLVAIIGLQGPLGRMSQGRRAEMLPHLLDAAAAISRELGGEG
ncbi:MAG: IclR family transcriptional regulator, regulon repressor [Solirubrobacterales bacterium]|nr:IclR family transcriptional regulator, regulon repressor [Solirubrobacterales bacterium]